MLLQNQDYQILLAVIRRAIPQDFNEGKNLVILEGKILQVLQNEQQQQIQAQVKQALAAAKDTDGDVPSDD